MNADDAWNLVDMMKSYFDDRSDIIDGSNGKQMPNKEMQFAQSCEELMTFLEKLT